MESKTIVRARIPSEVDHRLRSLSRFPRKEWGRHNVPDFYGDLILKYVDSSEFKAQERDAEVKRLISALSAKDILVKSKTFEIEKLRKELDSVKNQTSAA